MEKIKSYIKKIVEHPIFGIFLLMIIILWGVISAEDTTIVTTTPSSPSNFIYGTVTTSLVPLSWTDNSTNEDRFMIERKSSGSSTFSPIGQVGTDITSYDDTIVSPGAIYDYRIAACSSTICSGFTVLSGVVIPTTSGGGGGTTSTIPYAPTNLTYGTVTSTSVPLSWTDNANNEDKFNVERKLSTASTWMTLTQITVPDATSYSDNSVSAGVSYDYRVQACLSGTGCSEYAVLSGVNIPSSGGGSSGTPIAPTNLTASVTGNNVILNWSDNSSNEAGFKIYRGPTWTDIGNVGPNVTTFTDTNRPAGTYTYRLNAFNSSNMYSTISNDVSVTIGTTSSLPLPSTNLTLASKTTGSVTLSWTDNATNEDRYGVGRKLSTGSWGDTATTVSFLLPINATSYTDTSLSPGVIYDYRVFPCIIAVGCADPIYLMGITTSGSTTGTVPNVPSGLTYGTLTSSSVPLRWTDNSTNEDKFIIDRKLSGSTIWSSINQAVAANATSYNDTTVIAGTSYDYRIQACLTAIGCSNYAILSAVTVPSTTNTAAPSAPTNLTATVSGNNVILNWTDNSNNEAGFKIYRGPTWTDIGNVGPNVTTFTDSNRPAGTYTYRLNAFNSTYMYSGISNDVSVTVGTSTTTTPPTTTTTTTPTTTTTTTTTPATIPSTVPLPPTNLTITVLGNNAILNWTDNSNNEAGFKIYRGPTWTDIGNVGPNVITFVDSNRPAGNYIYRLNAFNSSYKYSAISNDVSVTIGGTIPSTAATTLSTTTPTTPGSTTTPGATTETASTVTTETTSNVITEKDISAITNTISAATTSVAAGAGTTATTESTVETINLIFKDTNKDGISDYDSIHVYNLDPVKPSPTSVYEGEKITAADKILLGFDPTKTELVKVEKEEPKDTTTLTTTSYKVEEIKLNDKKEIALKGKALPNSFITIYIYSTPIMVTVKTDANGEWQYTLDKELENGEHKIYTATVNNTGNIVAQSPGYLFTKTAEAVTLNDLPVAEASVGTDKPGFLESINIYLAVSVLLVLVITVLVLTGVLSRKTNKNY